MRAPFESLRSTGLGCSRVSQAVQARKLPVSQDATGQVPYRRYGVSQGRKVSRDALSFNAGREWGPRHPVGRGEGVTGQQDLVAAVTRWC